MLGFSLTQLSTRGFHHDHDPSASVPAPADRRRWLALAVVGQAQLLVIVGTTIVNIAPPTAQVDLGMSDVAR